MNTKKLHAFSFVVASWMATLVLGLPTPSFATTSGDSPTSCVRRALSERLDSWTGKKALAQAEISWNPIPLDWLRQVRNVPNSIVRIATKTPNDLVLFGKLDTVEVVPGYNALQITTPDGTIHLIDPELVRIQSAVVGPEKLDPSLEKELRRVSQEPAVMLDVPRLKTRFCADYSARAKTPEFDRLKEIVAKNFAHTGLQAAGSKSLKCAEGIVAGAAIMGANLSRQLFPGDNWYFNHSSNFAYSIAFMTAMDRCLSSLSPQHRNQFLAATIGTSTLLNIWEEVDLRPYVQNRSLPVFASIGNPVRTDIEDLKAGALGTLTYLVGIKILEHQMKGLQLAKVCK